MKEQSCWNFGWSFDPVYIASDCAVHRLAIAKQMIDRWDLCMIAGRHSFKNKTSQVWLTRVWWKPPKPGQTEQRPLSKVTFESGVLQFSYHRTLRYLLSLLTFLCKAAWQQLHMKSLRTQAIDVVQKKKVIKKNPSEPAHSSSEEISVLQAWLEDMRAAQAFLRYSSSLTLWVLNYHSCS